MSNLPVLPRGFYLASVCLTASCLGLPAAAQQVLPPESGALSPCAGEACDAVPADQSAQSAQEAPSPEATPPEAMPSEAMPSEAPPPEVDIELVWTQFASAFDGPHIAPGTNYGGKVDLFATIDGQALGLGKSVSISVHPEFRYGGDPNAEIGLLPVNTALFYPDDDGEQVDLAINVTKSWASGVSLTVGKLNALDYVAQIPVQGGGGLSGFRNLGIALPPSAIVPANLTGALLTVPTDKAIFRLWVYDPYLQSQRSGFEDPFATGVGGLAMVSFPTKIGGKPGLYSLKLTGTTRTGPPGEILPAILQPIPGGQWGRQKGTGSVTFSFQQFLEMDKDNPGKGIGIFGQAFLTDGDPNPLDWSAFFGLSGNIPGRPQDRFGLAYFHYSLSNELEADLSPFIAFEDEYGVEAYYTLGLTDWLSASADVQYVNSSIAVRGNAVIGTFALQTRF